MLERRASPSAGWQGAEPCLGGCTTVFGRPCFTCHQPAATDGGSTFSLALDLGNAQCAPPWPSPDPTLPHHWPQGRREHSLAEPTRTSCKRACQRPDGNVAVCPDAAAKHARVGGHSDSARAPRPGGAPPH